MKTFKLMLMALILMLAVTTGALAAGETIITLADGATTIEGEGASVEGDVVTITAAGEYTLSGTLTNGQIIVNVGDDEDVQLNFAGISIGCDFSSPIYVMNADKLEVKLVDGTENTLTDAYRAVGIDDKSPTACLYSKDDMTIKGTGALIVDAAHNNGIGSKNDLRISGGIITVSAVNNAIKGNDSVDIRGGRITILDCEDGIKAEKAEREDKGFVRINGATIFITALDDAIQAPLSVTITNSTVTTMAEDMAINCVGNISVQDGCLIEN